MAKNIYYHGNASVGRVALSGRRANFEVNEREYFEERGVNVVGHSNTFNGGSM